MTVAQSGDRGLAQRDTTRYNYTREAKDFNEQLLIKELHFFDHYDEGYNTNRGKVRRQENIQFCEADRGDD